MVPILQNGFLMLTSLFLLLLSFNGGGSRIVLANHGENVAETYDEQLIIRPLDHGQISAYFQFKTFVPTNLNAPYGVNAGRHNDIFPLSLLRLFHHHEIQELHLSLSKGLWKYDLWGLPIRETPPNAHLWAWFTGYLNAQENWRKLTSLLSGQFCASINLINPTVTIRPKMSYRPFLQQTKQQLNFGATHNQEYGYLAALPQEAICTENLTPWTKLLPCRSKKGFGNLLVATKIFNSRYFSMSLDFKFSCSDITNCQNTTGIELIQNIQIVFDAPLDNYNWALSYLFSNPVTNRCPLSSSSEIFIDVTGLENYQLKVPPSGFVRVNANDSPVANSKFTMTLTNPDDPTVRNQTSSPNSSRVYAYYNLKDQFDRLASKEQNSEPSYRSKALNIGITHSDSYQGILPYKTDFSTVQVRRQARGYGVLSGGLSIFLTNQLPTDIYAIYMDMIPWYLRMYLHTLAIECRSISNVTDDSQSFTIEPTKVHYEPARDRVRPHHLELLLRLPANSLVEIRFEYEHQFLLWTEYPPDPNHGLYINPATVTFFLSDVNSQVERFLPHLFSLLKTSPMSDASNGTDIEYRLTLLERFMPLRLYTEPILISMPTPDFSMPYNVVCLVSTVLSIAFGPIYNLTTRRTRLIRKYLTTTKKQEDSSSKSVSEQTIPKQLH